MSTFESNQPMNTVLTNFKNYDVESRLLLSQPEENSFGGSKDEKGPTISYKRIQIATKNEDGTIGQLIFKGQPYFSFGIQEDVEQGTGKLTGYKFPFYLWSSQTAPTEDDREFIKVLHNDIIKKVGKHLVSIRKKIGHVKFDERDFEDLSPIWFPRDKQTQLIKEDVSPRLFCKLIYSKKTDKILTQLFDPKGNELDPMSLINQRCTITPAIRVESVFIGKKMIKIQVKLAEAIVSVSEGTGRKSLLRQTLLTTSNSQLPLDDDDFSDEEEEGSLEYESDE